MITGAQLYTVRDFTQTESDFLHTIEQIAAMGYTTIQLSAIGQTLRPKWIREVCDSAGLKIVLTHSNPNRILHDTEALIDEHDILGCSYIGLGCMPEKYRSPETIEKFAEDFREPIRKIAASGKLFMYHNHNFEFERFGSRRMIDYLLDAFAPEELGVTLDTYWVQAAGGDVCQWIRRLKDRIPCVHLKDMAMISGTQHMAPVMEGNLNFTDILQELKQSCCKYLLVEQDVCLTSPFDCLRQSYDNLAAAGYR